MVPGGQRKSAVAFCVQSHSGEEALDGGMAVAADAALTPM
jgi:hypothetical protein